MDVLTPPTTAAEITARLDRLPMTRHLWKMVTLISLGGCFEVYNLFFSGYVAPGLFRAGIFTPTTVSLFGMTGVASFIAALFAGMFIGTILLSYRRPLRPPRYLRVLAGLVDGRGSFIWRSRAHADG